MKNLYAFCIISNVIFALLSLMMAEWGMLVFNIACAFLCYVGWMNNENT